jgi:Skp family chaperone for outer membrane proteins
MKNLKNKIFPLLIAFSALSVSASAAFYSVSGLSKLFAGASLEVIIMASSLEVAKLVIASLLYQYWDAINKGLRAYLTLAAGVLILITSMGIYGFLSAAYQETANKAGNIDAQVALVEVKRDNIKEQLAVYNAEKSTINGAVADLRAGLAGNVQTYKDKDGNILSTSSSANRKAFEKQLDQAIVRQTEINSKVDELNTKLFEYETEIVEISTDSELTGELGPLKYLSGLTGVAMDKIINVLLLIIIFVFDPLAIALVIAANFAFAQLRPKKEYPLEEQVEDMRKVVDAYDTLQDEIEDNEGSDIYTEDELSDWDETLMDGLEDEEDFTPLSPEIELPEEVIDEILEGEEFEVKPSVGTPIMVDPKSGRLFYIEEDSPEPISPSEELIIEDPQLKIIFPEHTENADLQPINLLTEEEKIFDLDNDGILNDQETKEYEAFLAKKKLLNDPGISSWRKRKIRDYLKGYVKNYW